MSRLTLTIAIVSPLAAIAVALWLAGAHAGNGREPAVSAPSPRRDWHARPVTVVNGWIVGDGPGAPREFEVRNCPAIAEVYDLAPAPGEVPALTEPQFTSAAEATWLADEAPVLGLKLGTEARCYPLAILNLHSLVHDRVNGQAIYVLWDPPSGLALARRVWAPSRPLGLAGLGFRGVGLAYELASGALWDLFAGMPISYPGRPDGFRPNLKPDYGWLPLERMTWRAWRRLHGDTLVLSRQTGHAYDYSLDPYAAAALGPAGAAEDYWRSDTLLALETLRDPDHTLPDKDWVIGFLIQGEPWAISLRQLGEAGRAEVAVATTSGPVTAHAWPDDDRFLVTDGRDQAVPQVRLFWFAWKARFPETRVWAPVSADSQ
jgi:hypothetical protein